MSNIKIETYSYLSIKNIFFLFLVLSISVGVLLNPRIMVPFFLSYILIILLNPIFNFYAHYKVKGRLVVLFSLFALLTMFSIPLYNGVNQLVNETNNIQEYIPKLEKYLKNIYSSFSAFILTQYSYEIEFNPVQTLISNANVFVKNMLTYIPSFIGSLLEWVLLVPFFLFFLIKDSRKIKKSLVRVVPNPIVEKVYYFTFQFHKKFSDYMLAKFIEASIIGITITVGLSLLNFPFAFLLGVFAGLTNILPYIGPLVGFVPTLIIALADNNPDVTLGAITLLFFIANFIDLALVFPILVSKIVNLHPLLVVVSVVIGSQLIGIIGMILSIPAAAFLKLVIQEIVNSLYPSDI